MIRVLVVDDSVVFRSMIKSAIDGHEEVEVVGVANNGRIALQKLAQSSVDLVTLDMEMPEMDGLETLREIRKQRFPVRVIVFSAHTTRGSEAALDALTAGADDFVTKPASEEGSSVEQVASRIRGELLPKIRQFFTHKSSFGLSASGGGGRVAASGASSLGTGSVGSIIASVPAAASSSYLKKDVRQFMPSVLVLGSSTGGPAALEKVLKSLVAPLRIPILIAQHMPPLFTATLAKRIQELSGIPAAEAKHLEEIKSNKIYIAPGDYHMSVIKRDDKLLLSLDQNPPRNSVRPAVDVLFETAAEHYSSMCMAFVFTGMGEDGLVGARAIKARAGGVMIQNRETCVVFGMPGAIYNASLYDSMGDLEQISSIIRQMTLPIDHREVAA